MGKTLINLFTEDSQIIHVKNQIRARVTWNTLKNIDERSNLSKKLYLLRKLYNAKLNEKGNMNSPIKKMLEIVEILKAIGEEISNSHFSTLLLCSLLPAATNLSMHLKLGRKVNSGPSLFGAS